jgi:hypothetical protein
VVLGVLGAILLISALAVTWLRPDGVIVAAFTGAAVLLIVLAANPTLPTKVTVGSNSVEWTPEARQKVVDVVYQEAMLDREGRGATSGGGDFRGPTLEFARRLAREATSAEGLVTAVRVAEGAAQADSAQG